MTSGNQTGSLGWSKPIISLFDDVEQARLHQDGQAMQAVTALCDFSPTLAQALAVRPDMARWLFLEKAFERTIDRRAMAKELSRAAHGVKTLDALQVVLRRFRLQELARLAVRDLTGRADLAEVMETLTNLADACLTEALTAAVRFAAERFKSPPDKLGLFPIILGMGKLGSRELNYSSDVDLIYLYRLDDPAEGRPPAENVAEFIFTNVSRALSDVTEDGLVFRVDMDLRPGGKDGALAQSLESARKHYLALGQPWERLALLRARPVAGDLDAAKGLLADLSPFVFRRHLDYTAIEELKALKSRFTKEKTAKVLRLAGSGRVAPTIDVKLSPGGIREVEFFAQALTLTFGGRLSHLRRSSTQAALAALAEEGLITKDDADELSRAYVFLRTAEHRIQLRELTQTQLVPRHPGSRDGLGRSMGFSVNPWPDFEAALKGHMDRVQTRFNLLLAEPGEGEGTKTRAMAAPDWVPRLLENLEDEAFSLNLLKEIGFLMPEAALAACRKMREERFLPDRLSRYRRQLERLLPVMIAGVAATPDPDRAILHLERFITSIGPKAGFFILLEENPSLIKVLSILFGASDYLSDVLINHPGILDSLVDRRAARVVKSRAALANDLNTVLGVEDDLEIRLGIIRRFKNDEILRIGLYDLLGELSLAEVQSQLTALAEVVMEGTLRLAAEQVLRGRPVEEPLPVAVMGMGKLGGKELSYGSDLDLIFFLGRGRGGRAVSLENAVRLTQRMASYLSLPLAEGPGYDIDARLRPSGGGGPLVVTPAAFARYHETSQPWERQALLKMRKVLGPSSLGARIRSTASWAIWKRDLPGDLNERMNDLRRRMTQERAQLIPDRINPKFSAGGLVDVEFITQYLQMVQGRSLTGKIRSYATRTALEFMVENRIGPRGLDDVLRAYELISRVTNRLNLIYARSGDSASYSDEEIESLALPVDGSDLLGAVRSAMESVERVYGEIFSHEKNHVG